MPLETASFINGLVVTNPASGDPQGQGDDHLRLLKSVLKNTFPNLSAAASGTPWQFNAATGSFSTTINDTKHRLRPQTLVSTSRGGGQVFEAGASATTYFEAYTDAGVWGLFALPTSGAASTGSLTLDANGNVGVSGNGSVGGGFNVGGSHQVVGNINSTTGKVMEGGNALIPAGVIVMWTGSVAPAGWAICNGTGGTPDLRNRFIVGGGSTYSYGSSGGATSWTGNTAAISAGTPTGSIGAGGDHNHGGSTGSYTLQITDIPSHTHTVNDPGHFHTFTVDSATGSVTATAQVGADGGGAYAPTANTSTATTGITLSNTGGGGGHSHTISASGTHTHTFTGDAMPTHYHSVTVTTLPPYYALAFIMKL